MNILYRGKALIGEIISVFGRQSGWTFRPASVASLPDNSYFMSVDKTNQWLCLDFKENRISPNAYTIRGDWDALPRSWVIELSNDGLDWKAVSAVVNSHILGQNDLMASFHLSKSLGFHTMIRIRQTRRNSDRKNILCIAKLEVFGRLVSGEEEISLIWTRMGYYMVSSAISVNNVEETCVTATLLT